MNDKIRELADEIIKELVNDCEVNFDDCNSRDEKLLKLIGFGNPAQDVSSYIVNSFDKTVTMPHLEKITNNEA